MELFEQFEKHLPAMRKHGNYLLNKVPPEEKVDITWKFGPAAAMIEWIWDELLDEHTMLYQTFLRVGIATKTEMSAKLFEWYLMDNRLRQNKNK